MQDRFRKVAVFAGTAALATGVGVGVASQGGGDANSRTALTERADGPGGPGQMHLSALAEELGVSTSRLRAAMEAARPTADPGAAGADAMAATLAEELGLSEQKVATALESFRPDGGARPDGAMPPGGSEPPAASGSTADATAA